MRSKDEELDEKVRNHKMDLSSNIDDRSEGPSSNFIEKRETLILHKFVSVLNNMLAILWNNILVTFASFCINFAGHI